MLTDAQKVTLKAAILADTTPAVVAAAAARDDITLADLMNEATATLAWRVAVTTEEVDEETAWTSFDTLSDGKRDSWGYFLRVARDFSKIKVRKWVTDVWGAATAGSNAEALLMLGTEYATRAEMMLGGTSKTTGTVSALKRNWTGSLSYVDIGQIMNG